MVTRNTVLKSLFTLLCVFLMTVSIAVADQDVAEQDQEGKFSAFQMFKSLILKVVRKAEAENEADTSNDNTESRFEAKKKVGVIKDAYYNPDDRASVGFFAGAIQRLKGAFSNEDQRRERCYDLYEEDSVRFDTDCRAFAEEVQYFIDSGEFDGTFDEAMAQGNGDDYWEDKQDEREDYCRDLLHENKEEFEEECSEFVKKAEVREELGEVRDAFDGDDEEFDDRVEYCKELYHEDEDQFSVECPEFVDIANRHERSEMDGKHYDPEQAEHCKKLMDADQLEQFKVECPEFMDKMQERPFDDEGYDHEVDYDSEHAERCKKLMDAEEFEAFKHECSEFAGRLNDMELPMPRGGDLMDSEGEHMPRHELPPMHFPEHMNEHEMKCKHFFESGDKEAFDVECRDMFGGDDSSEHDPDVDGELHDEGDPHPLMEVDIEHDRESIVGAGYLKEEWEDDGGDEAKEGDECHGDQTATGGQINSYECEQDGQACLCVDYWSLYCNGGSYKRDGIETDIVC
jgi:hypothetical protein